MGWKKKWKRRFRRITRLPKQIVRETKRAVRTVKKLPRSSVKAVKRLERLPKQVLKEAERLKNIPGRVEKVIKASYTTFPQQVIDELRRGTKRTGKSIKRAGKESLKALSMMGMLGPPPPQLPEGEDYDPNEERIITERIKKLREEIESGRRLQSTNGRPIPLAIDETEIEYEYEEDDIDDIDDYEYEYEDDNLWDYHDHKYHIEFRRSKHPRLYGMVDMSSAPYKIKINKDATNMRQQIATVHEVLHVVTDMYKISMPHDTLHALAIHIRSKILPYARTRKDVESGIRQFTRLYHVHFKEHQIQNLTGAVILEIFPIIKKLFGRPK